MTTITGAGAHSSAEATDKIPAQKGSTKGYLTPLQILTYISGTSTFQPLDSDLTAIAALTTTSYGRALLALADLAALRAVLGPSGTPSASTFLRGDGSWATPAGGGGGDLLAANNLSDVASAATARTNLGLAIGTNVQAFDADLSTWAGLTPSANAQSLVTAADYSAMRTLLGLVIGTNVQAYDADLTTWAGLTPSANAQSLVTAADYSAMRTLLGLVIGTNVQAYDADLTTWAGITPGTGVATALAIAIGSAGAPVTNGGALGTPASGTLTNCTGLPPAGIAGLAAEVVANFSGGGSAITTGVKGFIVVPYAMTITSATILADTSGAIVIDVWKDTYANYPPDNSDSITASAPPTITASGVKSQDSTLTGWTTSVAAGDILGFNVDSCTAITQATLILRGTRA